jgi:hypothetical protein
LKLPNGQFPLKIPGPISQAKPKPIKKKFVPFRKEKKLNGGVAILLKKSLLVNLITFLGAEGFRRAPMMQQKLTTLTRTELDTHHKRRRKMYFIRIYLSGTQHNNTIQYNTDILGALSGRTINKEFNTMIMD